MDTILAIDAGNSRLKFGLFERGADSGLPPCRDCHALPLDWSTQRTHVSSSRGEHAARAPVGKPPAARSASSADGIPWSTLRTWIASPDLRCTARVIAGANPAAIAMICDAWPDDLGPPPQIVESNRLYRPESRAGGALSAPTSRASRLRIDVEFPEKVGIDRLLNAVAVNVIRPPDRPAIVIDTGTATTVDAVSADGAFLGGAILPGFELGARSLHQYTALLPLISIDELAAEEPAPLGRETRAALRSGLFWGQLGAVRELTARLQANASRPAFVVLTGGGAPLLAPHLPEARWEPHLSLQGLVLMEEQSTNGAREA